MVSVVFAQHRNILCLYRIRRVGNLGRGLLLPNRIDGLGRILPSQRDRSADQVIRRGSILAVSPAEKNVAIPGQICSLNWGVDANRLCRRPRFRVPKMLQFSIVPIVRQRVRPTLRLVLHVDYRRAALQLPRAVPIFDLEGQRIFRSVKHVIRIRNVPIILLNIGRSLNGHSIGRLIDLTYCPFAVDQRIIFSSAVSDS